MTMDSNTAVQLTQWLLAIGLALQSIESLVAWRTFGNRIVFVLRLILALSLLVPATVLPPFVLATVHLVLLLTAMLLIARLRGPLCGGSDAMWFQVQLGLLLASLAGWHPVLVRVGLGWIAAQSVLSYFLAGVVKFRNPRWRRGEALQCLLASDGPYVIWVRVRRLAGSAAVCRALAWAAIGFELLFPLVLMVPVEWRGWWLAAGLMFHLGNAVVLGLNRFVWAWAATYPALLSL